MAEIDERWRGCKGTWDRLRWARKVRGGFDTAKAAAEALGINENTYGAYERSPDASKHIPLDHERAAQFARKFKVSWTWLLRGAGTPYSDGLTAAQQRVVTAMTGASDEDQERAATVIEALLKRG